MSRSENLEFDASVIPQIAQAKGVSIDELPPFDDFDHLYFAEEDEVARAIPVCMRAPEELAQDLRRGVPIPELDVLSTAWLRKSGASVASPHMLTPIGGKARETNGDIEGPLTTALRETDEETLTLGLRNPFVPNRQSEAQANIYQRGPETSFSYGIRGYDQDTHVKTVRYVVFDATQPEEPFQNTILPAPDEDKAVGVEYLTTAQTVAMIRNLPEAERDHVLEVIGSSRKGPAEDILIDERNAILKDEILDDVCEIIAGKEEQARKLLLSTINGIRIKDGFDPYDSLSDPRISIAEVVHAQERIIRTESFKSERFLERKGLSSRRFNELREKRLGRKIADVPEDETPEERKRRRIVNKLRGEMGPLLGVDVLKYAQFFARNHLETFDSLDARTTRSILTALRYAKLVARDALAEELPAHFKPGKDGSDSLEMLFEFETYYSHLERAERENVHRRLHRNIVSQFCKDFNLDENEVLEVATNAAKLAGGVIEDVTGRDHIHPFDISQDSDEYLGVYLLQSLGLPAGLRGAIYCDIEQEGQHTRRSRFESSLMMGLMMKGLTIYEDWKPMKAIDGRTMTRSLLESLGNFEEEEVRVVVKPNGENMEISLYRVSYKGTTVWLEFPPEKTFRSYLMKRLQESGDRIFDVYRFNVIVGEEYDYDDDLENDTNLELTREISETLHHHMAASLDDITDDDTASTPFWVEVVEGTYEDEPINAAEEGFDPDAETIEAKRSGSKASDIIRLQYNVVFRTIDGNGDLIEIPCEICVYPWMNIPDSEKMGFIEKRLDDDRYYVAKQKKPMRPKDWNKGRFGKNMNVIGFPSIFGLIRPGQSYPHAAKLARERQEG